jgi:O-antigen/teichoic acid export membrane protein
MSLKNQAVSGVIWSFIEQFSNQIIGFILSIVLMRLLSPADFGLMAMIYVFFTIANVVLESGLNFSLIRTKNATELDYCTVFYFNIFLGIVLFLMFFFIAPLIALFFKQIVLTNIIRVYSISFIISACTSIQNTIFIKHLEFKKTMLISLFANSISAVVGIYMAYNNYGVWAIVYLTLSALFVTSVTVWFVSKWRPKLIFDWKILKFHLNFGYKLTLTNLSDAFFRNTYNLIIGKVYPAAILGFYSRADSIKKLSVYVLITAVNKVSYPLLAAQNDEEIVNKKNKKLIQISGFLTTPLLIFLIIYAEPVIVTLFSEKWRQAIPFYQILCISGILFPMTNFNVSILNVKGRSDLVLKLEVINKLFLIICVYFTYKYSIYVMLYTQILFSIFEYCTNIYISQKISNYSLINQIKDYSKVLLTALLTALLVYIIDNFFVNIGFGHIIRLIFGTIIFGILYLGLSDVFKIESFIEIKDIVISRLTKIKQSKV